MLDAKLESAIRNSWSACTSAGDNDWTIANPSAGHCDVTALVIREMVGGDLRMALVFRNHEFSEHHYWNVLVDGTDFDLTREQFDGTETFQEVITMTPDDFTAAGPMKLELLRRLNHFRALVNEQLSMRTPGTHS